MANYAFLSLWCRNFSTANMLGLYARLLQLFPASAQKPGFYSFTIRCISLHETPLMEQDGVSPLSPETILAMAREFLHDDYAYETVGYWDLWQYSLETGELLWRMTPTPVEFACYGRSFEEGVAEESGHFCLKVNFEHLYTGHAGLLVEEPRQPAASAEEVEQDFLRALADVNARREYRQRTLGNIEKLLGYVAQLEKGLPVERRRLWSEGEADFEQKLRHIQAI